jgi:hypothetical protein
LNDAFYDFLELTKLIERDKDMESFLWTLDGGWRQDDAGECDLDRVSRALTNPRRFARALQLPSDDRGETDRALNGFYKFIQFCERMTALLERVKPHPELAEAIWMAHAYWLRQMDSRIGARLKLALRSLVKWKVSRKDKGVLRVRVRKLEQLIERLASPPLADWRAVRKTETAELTQEQMRIVMKQAVGKIPEVKTFVQQALSGQHKFTLASPPGIKSTSMKFTPGLKEFVTYFISGMSKGYLQKTLTTKTKIPLK